MLFFVPQGDSVLQMAAGFGRSDLVHSLLSHGANLYAVTKSVISIPVLAVLTASAMTLHKDIAVLAFSLVIAAFSKVCYMPDCLHANLQSAVVLFLSRMTKRLAACLVPCSVCCREKRYYMQVLAAAGLRWCKCSLPMVQEQMLWTTA